jgi:hypothetical protein
MVLCKILSGLQEKGFFRFKDNGAGFFSPLQTYNFMLLSNRVFTVPYEVFSNFVIKDRNWENSIRFESVKHVANNDYNLVKRSFKNIVRVGVNHW